jgi:hypothetical protein
VPSPRRLTFSLSLSGAEDLLDRVDIWTLEGELGFANMLDLAINENTAAKSLALIALDLSQPWALVETLEKWIKVLENHLEARSLKDEKSEGLGMPLLVVVNKVLLLSCCHFPLLMTQNAARPSSHGVRLCSLMRPPR